METLRYSVLSPLQFSGIFSEPVKDARAPGISIFVCTKLVLLSLSDRLLVQASFLPRWLAFSVSFFSPSTQSRCRGV